MCSNLKSPNKEKKTTEVIAVAPSSFKSQSILILRNMCKTFPQTNHEATEIWCSLPSVVVESKTHTLREHHRHSMRMGRSRLTLWFHVEVGSPFIKSLFHDTASTLQAGASVNTLTLYTPINLSLAWQQHSQRQGWERVVVPPAQGLWMESRTHPEQTLRASLYHTFMKHLWYHWKGLTIDLLCLCSAGL